MSRILVKLDDELQVEAREEAAQQGIALAGILERALRLYLRGPGPVDPLPAWLIQMAAPIQQDDLDRGEELAREHGWN